jgi:uncharacterized protein (TIGR03492 family)
MGPFCRLPKLSGSAAVPVQPEPDQQGAGDLLFISNGHGEDLNGSLICGAVQALNPQLLLAALPIVGGGGAYRRRGLPLLLQGRDLPSGGMVYQGWNLWKDLASGWLAQTLAQLRAARNLGRRYRLVLSVGDHVPLLFAWLTGRPTVVFLVSTSSYYEGRLRLSRLTRWLCNRGAVRLVLCRDAFTARDLQAQGLAKARFLGYPIMDALGAPAENASAEPRPEPSPDPSSQQSPELSAIPIALLPGSRQPEAQANLVLQLQVCERLAQIAPDRSWLFEAAVGPGTVGAQFEQQLAHLGWTITRDAITGDVLVKGGLQVSLRSDAFAAILRRSRLVLGMAGTAVEQAVGLGKPVVQLVGRGPQFSYAFAEAQMRLLGEAVFTVGNSPAGTREIHGAAALIVQLLADPDLPQLCHHCGLERVGLPGGSTAIAQALLEHLEQISPPELGPIRRPARP